MTGETVTILRAGASTTQDVYGNDVPGADVRIDVDGCLIAPRLAGDVSDPGRNGVMVGHEVQFPKTRSTDPRATDRLEFRGEEHTIVGDVQWWNGAPGKWDTLVATQRVEG